MFSYSPRERAASSGVAGLAGVAVRVDVEKNGRTPIRLLAEAAARLITLVIHNPQGRTADVVMDRRPIGDAGRGGGGGTRERIAPRVRLHAGGARCGDADAIFRSTRCLLDARHVFET